MISPSPGEIASIDDLDEPWPLSPKLRGAIPPPKQSQNSRQLGEFNPNKGMEIFAGGTGNDSKGEVDSDVTRTVQCKVCPA